MAERSIISNGWGVLWRTSNKSLDGVTSSLLGVYAFRNIDNLPKYVGCSTAVFPTRRATRVAIEETYGYIRARKDLRHSPHGWLMPIPVRIKLTVTVEVTNG